MSRPRNVDRVAVVYPVGRTKTCTACKREKPWSAFYVRERWPDGMVKAVRTKCKLCESEIAAARWQEKLARPDREDELAERRTYHAQRMMLDDEYAARVRKTARENNRLRYATDPIYRQSVIDRSTAFNATPRGRALEKRRRRRARSQRRNETSMRLPSEPWYEWLAEERPRFADIIDMAKWMGVDESALRKWLDKTNGILLDNADAVLCTIGQPHLLMLLWPELYTDNEEEATG